MSLASCCSSISSFASFEELESSRGSAIDCSCSSKFESADESSDDESPVSGFPSIVSSFSGLNRTGLSNKMNQNNPLAFPFQTLFIQFSQLQSWPQWSNITIQTPQYYNSNCLRLFSRFYFILTIFPGTSIQYISEVDGDWGTDVALSPSIHIWIYCPFGLQNDWDKTDYSLTFMKCLFVFFNNKRNVWKIIYVVCIVDWNTHNCVYNSKN